MRRRRGLRLLLPRQPDPVIEGDDLDWLGQLVRSELKRLTVVCDGWRTNSLMRKPSEADIRAKMSAEDVLAKLEEAGAWRPSS
jgi:hypothetical protein